jgi:hypothetical protein
METQLFTVVLDYGGGNYVAQVRATSVRGALRAWISTAPDLGIPCLDLDPARFLTSDEIFLQPVLLDGLTNAWCTSVTLDDGLALFNIVATSEDSVGEETVSEDPIE